MIGFLGYYRTYAKDFSIKLKNIYDLLQVDNYEGKKCQKKKKKQLDSCVKINWTP